MIHPYTHPSVVGRDVVNTIGNALAEVLVDKILAADLNRLSLGMPFPPRILLPFYQFTQPSVAVSPFSGNLVDFFDSFSVRFLRGQGPQNATHGDRDSLPTGPPTARAGDPTGPSPAVRRPPRSLSTATRRARPH